MACPRGVMLFLIAVVALRAQTVGASLQGAIIDPSDAVIPGAQIEIRNRETGAISKIESDSSGRYRVPVLPPGEYEVRAAMQGFQSVIRRGIHLAVGQDAVLDIELQLG